MPQTLTCSGPGTFARGIHPPPDKQRSADLPISVLPNPKSLRIALQQHTGAPAKPLITTPRTPVVAGQPLAEAGGFVSVPMHAPLPGLAGKPEPVTLANGRHVPAIPIVVEGQQDPQALYDDHFAGEWPLCTLAAEEIRTRIQAAGLVGLGGAAFPTHVKFAPRSGKPVDTILVNGCECEPALTADDRIMREAPQAVVAGTLIAGRAADATHLVIAVEANKPEAIAALRQAVNGTGVRIAVLEARYPMGGEKQTCRAALGRTIPTGGLPLDVGTVVINVGTATAIARAVLRGKPLTHRVVTLTGSGLRRPANLLVPIGTSLLELIDHCGGLPPTAARIVVGGPMMGFAIGDPDTPLTKGTSGVSILVESQIDHHATTSCIRCGRCTQACPLALVPQRLALAIRHDQWDLARRYHLPACMECGCCAYVCPARIPLVQLLRVGKARLPKA